MKPLPIVIVLLMGFVLGALFGYRRWHKPNHTTMVLGNAHKMIPHVQPGETLSWQNHSAGDVTVKFLYGGGLCVGKEDGVSTCLVKPHLSTVKLRYYTYQCVSESCQDPDAGGGTDVVIQGSGAGMKTARVAPDVAFHIYCQNGTSMVDPNPASLNKGQTIAWEPTGTAGDSWAVGPDLSNVCGVAKYDDSNAANGCTVLQRAPATTTYTVTTEGCANSTATINVAQ